MGLVGAKEIMNIGLQFCEFRLQNKDFVCLVNYNNQACPDG